jgi:hypothetical protein
MSATRPIATSHTAEIMAAIRLAGIEGLHVIPVAEYGVLCHSSHARNRWGKDPRARGVNPIGAVVIAAQPEATDPDNAAMMALGVSAAWLEGFAAGVTKQEPETKWSRHIARHIYREGFVTGGEVRAQLRRRALRVVES